MYSLWPSSALKSLMPFHCGGKGYRRFPETESSPLNAAGSTLLNNWDISYCTARTAYPLAQQEQEASHFAASFLMPKSSVLAQMPRQPSTRQIIAGKRIWKVAAMALTHRLYEIGLSSDWHYRNASIELGRLGYRSGEPQGIQRESSQVFTKVFSRTPCRRVRLFPRGQRPSSINDRSQRSDIWVGRNRARKAEDRAGS